MDIPGHVVEEAKTLIGPLPSSKGLRSAVAISTEHNFFQVYGKAGTTFDKTTQSVREFVATRHDAGIDAQLASDRTVYLCPLAITFSQDELNAMRSFFIHYLYHPKVEFLQLPLMRQRKGQTPFRPEQILEMIQRQCPGNAATVLAFAPEAQQSLKKLEFTAETGNVPIRLLSYDPHCSFLHFLRQSLHHCLRLLHFGECLLFQCLMNPLGRELNKMFLCPICLRKLSAMLSLDPIARYHAILTFLQQVVQPSSKNIVMDDRSNLDDLICWYEERLITLDHSFIPHHEHHMNASPVKGRRYEDMDTFRETPERPIQQPSLASCKPQTHLLKTGNNIDRSKLRLLKRRMSKK